MKRRPPRPTRTDTPAPYTTLLRSNKSHSAAYALLAYPTAWLKAHYPAEFYAASMCFDMHQTDKLCIFVDDMRRMGITCLPPCINASEAEFSVEPHEDANAVRYALGGLKGVGEKAMEIVVVERDGQGDRKRTRLNSSH